VVLGPILTGAENLAPTSIRSSERPIRSELLRCRGSLFRQIQSLTLNTLVIPYTQFYYLFRHTVTSSGEAYEIADTAAHWLW